MERPKREEFEFLSGTMVQSGASGEIRGFKSLATQLRKRNWDILVDNRNQAFITPFENDFEKWEMEVKFHDKSDFLVSSRSRWTIENEDTPLMTQALERLNDRNAIGTFGSHIGINEELNCFEVKTSSELAEKKTLDAFFATVYENTELYGRWSETVQKVGSQMDHLREIKDAEDVLAESGYKDAALENRLNLLSDAFLEKYDEESVLRTD